MSYIYILHAKHTTTQTANSHIITSYISILEGTGGNVQCSIKEAKEAQIKEMVMNIT